MGLSMIHGIVESYGGVITVNSEPDKGTTFTVYLPVIRKPIEAEFFNQEKALPGK
jgi:signal transduction histidine kinase